MHVFSICRSRQLMRQLRGQFSLNLEPTKNLLRSKLYSINLINKYVSRPILSMSYSPGVACIASEIRDNPVLADTLTMRGRSVALITTGKMLDVRGKQIMPVMDWLIAQIKYNSGIDSFPFVVQPNTNIEESLKDFASSYRGVILLDNIPDLKHIPEDLFVLKHQQVTKLAKCELTDAESTASVIAYAFKNGLSGVVSDQHIKNGLNFEGENFKNKQTYDYPIKEDGTDLYSHSMRLHKQFQGKIGVELNFFDMDRIKPYFTEQILRELVKQQSVESKTQELSAIVTDGTAVLGFGNIGPKAALTVMEGKSLLFKLQGDVQIVPFCMNHRQSTFDACKNIDNILGNFSAINVEDIKAPECFEIEEMLMAKRKQPIFDDDQHGTAIVTLAGLINATKVAQKDLKSCIIVINGAGAAGITVANLLLAYGVKDIIVCDSHGALYKGRKEWMNIFKEELAQLTNISRKKGTLKEVLKGTDVFIGVSVQNALEGPWISSMNKKSIIFAMANPIPEIMPEDAKAAGAYVYGSGRSDFQNQINTALVFPGIFKGIRKHSLKRVTIPMKIKAAQAIASCLFGQPRRDYIIPDSLDKDVSFKIAQALNPDNYKE